MVAEVEGRNYGFLIEDKIDAIAMPKQHDRYIKRGDKGIAAGEYSEYRLFIFCPEKYYQSNSEARKYEHLLTYEECKGFFDSKGDPLSMFRSQQLEQGINKAKKVSQLPVNETANAFNREYMEYQKTFYPSLDMSTKADKNGWWTDYRTELGYVYIVHKIQEGYVDLVFPKAAEKTEQVKAITEWLRHHGMPDVSIEKLKKSTMIRVRVPKINMKAGFETANKADLNVCFDTIKEFTEFANVIETASSIAIR